MSKLRKEMSKYGEPFSPIKELDKAIESMEKAFIAKFHEVDAKIDAITDILAEITAKVRAMEPKKTVKKNAEAETGPSS